MSRMAVREQDKAHAPSAAAAAAVAAAGRVSTFTVVCLSLLLVGTLHALHVLAQRRGAVDVELVWCSGLLTAVTTGLGVVPFLFTRSAGGFDHRWVAGANAMAAGMMLAASMGLVEEGAQGGKGSDVWRCAAGFVVGAGFIYWTKKRLDDAGDSLHVLDLDSLDTKKVLMVMGVMTLHSLSEGVGVGVSYHSQSLGAFITATLAVHNIPEGVAIAIVMLPRGIRKADCVLWCIVSSLPQPFMAVPAFLFVEVFSEVFAFGLGFAAGAMSCVSVSPAPRPAPARRSLTDPPTRARRQIRRGV
jgi:ZIP family zinc transporter